jgi:hypothetical protein
MRIRGLFFFRRYHIPTFVIVLLLFGLVLMSLRVKQRQCVAFLDALLLQVTFPARKAATLAMFGYQRPKAEAETALGFFVCFLW